MNVFTSFKPEIRRNLLIIFSAGLLFWSSLASLLPVLPLYVKSLGADAHLIGIVMGAFAIGLLGGRNLLADLADTRGRKLVLLIGITIAAIAPFGYVLTDSIPLLIGIRALHGVSVAAFALAYSALVVDLSPIEQRGEVIGYMSLVSPIGLAIGPALGGFLQSAAGFTPAFLMTCGLGAMGMLCTQQIQEGRSIQSTSTQSTSTQSRSMQLTLTDVREPAASEQVQANRSPKFWQLLVEPRIRVPAIVLLLVGLAFGTLSTFVPLLIESANVRLNTGLFYTTAAIASFSMRLLVGRASDRLGRGLFISVSLLLYATAMAMISHATSASGFLLSGILEGAGIGMLVPMFAALMADRADVQERGKTFGVIWMGFDAGIALAGPGLGAIVDQLGYRGMFSVASALVFLGLMIFMTRSSKNIQHSIRFALGMGRDCYRLN